MSSMLDALRRLEAKSPRPAAPTPPPEESPKVAVAPSQAPTADPATATLPIVESWLASLESAEVPSEPRSLKEIELVQQAIAAELQLPPPQLDLPPEPEPSGSPVAESSAPELYQSYLPELPAIEPVQLAVESPPEPASARHDSKSKWNSKSAEILADQRQKPELQPRPAPPEAWPDLAQQRTSREDIDQLCDAIRGQLAPGIPPSLLLTSADSAAGATSVLLQLADTLTADNAIEVLVVDANLANPDLSRQVGRAKTPGLADVLAKGAGRGDVIVRTERPGLMLLPAGIATDLAWDRVAEANFAVLLHDLKRHYDVVLVDAPDVWSPQVCGLSRCCDVTYLVIRLGQTPRWDAASAIRHLQTTGGRATGAILTRA